MPGGSYLFHISAGDQPPPTTMLRLRQNVDGYSGAQDTYISAWDNPPASHSYDQGLMIHHQADFATLKSLLRYDLSSLPTGANLRYAILSTAITQYPAENGMPVSVYTMNKQWIDTEATWTNASASVSWSVSGAEGVPGDRAAEPIDTRAVYPVISRLGFDVTDAVKGWLANPSSNNGLVLRSAPTVTTYSSRRNDLLILGSGNSYSENRPDLVLIYSMQQSTSTPTNTPTPTATPTETATPHSDSYGYGYTYCNSDARAWSHRRNPVL